MKTYIFFLHFLPFCIQILENPVNYTLEHPEVNALGQPVDFYRATCRLHTRPPFLLH